MSCCGGNCGCGASCSCGKGCSGCNMYPDLSYSETAASTKTVVLGVAPQKTYIDGAAAESVECGGENGCKCGANCTCDPCTCK